MDDLIKRKDAIDIVLSTSGDSAAALSEFDKLPSVEAEPIVHGKWVRPKRYKKTDYFCSACGASAKFKAYYCPWCGAYMDLEMYHSMGVYL